jgi:hypothetical protein
MVVRLLAAILCKSLKCQTGSGPFSISGPVIGRIPMSKDRFSDPRCIQMFPLHRGFSIMSLLNFRFSIKYSILYFEEKYPDNVTLRELKLFKRYFFDNLLDLVRNLYAFFKDRSGTFYVQLFFILYYGVMLLEYCYRLYIYSQILITGRIRL